MSPRVARLGLGLAAVARPAYITLGRADDLGENRSPEELRERAHELLSEAYTCGVRYFDVARSYGRAEEFLASWLAAHPSATDVTVGSKWGYTYVGEWRLDAEVHEVKEHSLAAFERQLAETTALLGRWLSVYYVHSATVDSGVLGNSALHAAMARLRDSGVRVGLSTSGPGQGDAIHRAMRVDVGGDALFSWVEATWNLLERSAEPALADWAADGRVVVVKEAVANGRLTPAGSEPRVDALAQRAGVPADVLAIAAALAQPWASYVLSGAVTVEQLRSNLAATEVTLPAELLDELADELADVAEPPEDYWGKRRALSWS